MLRRIVYISQPAWLSYENKQVVIRFKALEEHPDVKRWVDDKGEIRYALEDLGFVVLDHRQITLTHPLLAFMAKENVVLISCDETHHPIGLHFPLYSNTLQTERYRIQIEASEPLRKQLWAQLVRQKIKNQAAVLSKIGKEVESNYLLELSKAVLSGDRTNVEATASAYYWQRVFDFVPGFFRKREGPPPNHWLNYGYAILRAVTARALVASGLLPTLGLHHHNRYNPFCLADDLMEPFRPEVDLVIYHLIKKIGVQEDISKAVKQELLFIPYIDVILEKEKSPLMNGVQFTCQSLVKCLSGEQRKLILPEVA